MTPVRLFDRLYGAVAAPIFALVALCVVGPLIILGPTLAVRRWIGRHALRLAFLCIGAPLRVHGLERLPAGPCIAVANHASYLDGLLLCAALPTRFTFVVQDGAADWPYIGFVIHRLGASFINRSSAREGAVQTRLLIRRVQEGESLAIFAEGTFEPEPGLLPFKKGAFLIAAHAGVPVVPIGIRGSRRLYGGHRRLPRWSTVDIGIQAPLPVSSDARRLRDAARRAVLQACGEPDLQPSIPVEAEA